TAVHQIAAGHRRRELVLLRSEFPNHVPVAVQVDGVNVIRIGTLKIHHLSNDERLPFMTSKRACGHGPCDFKLPGILGVDLVQTAVASAGIISERYYPLISVL